MLTIIENKSLKKLNSFGLDANAAKYSMPDTIAEATEIFNNSDEKETLILGEGSNLLFSRNFNGLIIHPRILGKEVIDENSEKVILKVFCGENWDDLVAYCVERNWGGLENLSLIPGSVGSSPVQNIGAYGVEVKDRIKWVEGIKKNETKISKIPNSECRFEYRNSIFKKEMKNKFLITAVVFQLDKKPKLKTDYGKLSEVFSLKEHQNLTSMRESVIEIRNSKLPDPEEFGNSGSFFKNPVISSGEFHSLQKKYPEIPSYNVNDGMKIPAAWLIEQTGWKGKREGKCGTWPTQPLVIVNYGGATGNDILQFSRKIQQSVSEKFGIDLDREVNLI